MHWRGTERENSLIMTGADLSEFVILYVFFYW